MDIYGLIGFPLGHSFSRGFFSEKFLREGIDADYRNFEIPEAGMIVDVVRNTPGLKGLNCTIPHKQAIIPYLDEMSPDAEAIGAVNVVKVLDDGRLKGYNADIIGFVESIRPFLCPHHRKALVLGTGGASKAVCAGLEKLGIEWTYVSRKPKDGQLIYEDISSDVLTDHKVIVNCSPVGMYPHIDEAPALPYASLTPHHLLFDLIYNPEITRFMQQGAQKGATVKNGLEMLHLQALASWDIWNAEPSAK